MGALGAAAVRARGEQLYRENCVLCHGENAERAIDPRNAWIMTSLLRDAYRVKVATNGPKALTIARPAGVLTRQK